MYHLTNQIRGQNSTVTTSLVSVFHLKNENNGFSCIYLAICTSSFDNCAVYLPIY
jgi:hypothetical protein